MSNVLIDLKCIDIYVFRAPIEQPVVTSFGVLRDRPSLLVRLEDGDGACRTGISKTCGVFPNCWGRARG